MNRVLVPIALALALLAGLFAALNSAQPARAQGGGAGCSFTFGGYVDWFEDSITPVEGAIDYTHDFTIEADLIVARTRAINPPFLGTLAITDCGSIAFSTPADPYVICCAQPVTCGGVDYSGDDICNLAYGTGYNATGFDLDGPLGPSSVSIVAGAQDESGWPLVYYLFGTSYTATLLPTPTPQPSQQHPLPLSSGETFDVVYEWTFGDIAIVSLLIVIATIMTVRLVYDVARHVWFSLRID